MTQASDPLLLHLRLGGVAQLRRGSRSLVLERKAAGALAWLALRGPVQRERLARILWPASKPEGARNSLRQLIFKLKRAMDSVVIEGQDELRLPATVALDFGAEGDVLLEGCDFQDCPDFEAWLERARAEQLERGLLARAGAVDAAIEAGELDQALALAKSLLVEDRFSELAHQRLVRVLYLRGERAAALEAAQRCETILQDELGVAPSAAMQELVQTVRQASAPDARPLAMPVSVMRPPRMIGRNRELALLQQAVAEARVAMLVGEPGLGKSRLLAEAAETLPGSVLLSSRPGDAGVPFAALARWLDGLRGYRPAAFVDLPMALHRVMPEQGHLPGDERVSRLDLQRALSQVFVRTIAHGLQGVLFDDLHFADDASVEALQSLLDESALQGLHWMLARRPAEGGAALQRLSNVQLDEGRLLLLTLQPLDEAQVIELIVSLELPEMDAQALGPELARTTGGNPMFVLETLKAMLLHPAASGGSQRLPRPQSVGALIERRLQRLSAQALALARVAALAGPDFSTDLAMDVLHTPLMALTDAWAELEAAQILRDNSFAHDLVFEATLASVPMPIRRHARRAIAEFLAPRDAEPARLAEHWVAAGEPARAAPLFLAAGRRAEAAARYAEARILFERSSACHDEAGQAGLALDTRLALADLLMEAGQFQSSQEIVDGMFASALIIDDRLRISMQQMNLFFRQGLVAEGLQVGEQALIDPDVIDEATAERLAMLRWNQANGLLVSGRAPEALIQLNLAEPVLSQIDDPQWRGWFHSQHGAVLSEMGEMSLAMKAHDLALEAARTVGRKRMIAGCLQNGATCAHHRGRLVEALDRIDECLLLMVDTGGDDIFTNHVRAQRGRLLSHLGRYAEAIDAFESLIADCNTSDHNPVTQSHLGLALVWSQLGQMARAQAAMQSALASGTSLLSRIGVEHMRCELAWLAGDPHDELIETAHKPGTSVNLQARSDILRWRSRPERIQPVEVAARRLRWSAGGLDGHVVVADVLAAMSGWQRGDGREAAQCVARALPALRHALLAGIYRPWLALEMARCARAGDPELADRALRDGVDWIHSVARFHVPEAFRDSFLKRNRINRELLALARQHGQ